MKRTLIAFALALGATTAFATPTLELYGDELRGWTRAEGTVYQSDTPARYVPDPRNDYPFNP